MLDQLSSVFFEEANELLDNLEDYLLTLENEPQNQEVIGAIFRAMHTIKGSSGMFGFDAIQNFTHEMENAFDMVRNGIVPVTNALITLTLTARDHIRSMLGNEITPELQAAGDKIISDLHGYVSEYKSDDTQVKEEVKKSSPAQVNQTETTGTTWRIIFRPAPSILQNGTRPELMVKELCDMGTYTVVAFTETIPTLSDLVPEECYISWDIILTTDKTENDIKDVFIFLDNDSKVTIEKINENLDTHHKIGEILIDRQKISRTELDTIVNEQKKIGQVLVEQNIISEAEVKSALAEQDHLKKMQETVQKQRVEKNPEPPAAQQSIRVNSEKLDQLIDLVGEMVTFNARLAQMAEEEQNQQLTTLSELSERLIFALRDNAMDMRMLPIGTIFSRFRRLVHDLSNQLGKNIELITEGAETELDKTVIEKLNDPLIHLIRNSADHGIEMPDVRVERGKEAKGTVTLSAKHAGAFVLITISDDGNGLDKEAIRNKAIEKGLIQATDEITDNEIYELIFKPGFSTNKNVTSISGRGVGMDVVRRDIGSLGGTVSVETELGKGSSFILKIPLTLAIIDGMLVQIGEQQFVIPLTNIEECVELDNTESIDTLCMHITTRGEYLPCINMHTYFELEKPTPLNSQVVVVNDNDSKIGIIVDSVIGNHQTVIKPIGELYKHIIGISGATILGNGSIALILDILKLSQVVKRLEQEK
ncbi:MAG: chemotaxis protein CheA [Treponema sp.]|nr:chemotaxis protein CheA [Treponema sp.]